MARTKTTTFSALEESPLLNRPSAQPNGAPRQSTINLNKFDQARFTEIVDDGARTSPIKIIVYIVIVIVIGVGAALLVRSLITNNQAPTGNSTTPTPATSPSNVSVSTTAKADSTASTPGANADYSDSELTKVGDSSLNGATSSIDKFDFTRYTTFGRVTFTLSGNGQKLPATNLTYSAAEKSLTVNIPGLKSVDADLQKQIDVNSIVKTVVYDSATKNFKITFVEDTKYRVVPNTSNLVIDFKTVKELAKPDTTTPTPTPAPTPTPTTTPTPTPVDGSKPAAPHYDNEMSQNKQYVVSSVTGNTITNNVYYFDDLNSSFEFSWGQKDAVGDSYVPNTTAYYDTSAPAGKVYLMVEISNLTGEFMSANGVTEITSAGIQSKTGADTSGANLTKITLVSFDGGVAKYRFELKNKADFKVWTQKTVDNATQVISVRIND
ncbi:MAG: hypothetical protein ABIM99_03800 [Candidatus Dojkabacteria bacterium]